MKTEKKIEQFLHLYLGCDCQHPSDKVPFKLVCVNSNGTALLRGDWSGGTHNVDQIGSVRFDEFKLRLRPLSSMSEEEFNESPLLHSYKEAVRNLSLQYQPSLHGEIGKDISEEEAMKKVRMTWAQYMVIVAFPPIKLEAETFRYLLSKGFGIFNLHESGLCIYESDLKS